MCDEWTATNGPPSWPGYTYDPSSVAALWVCPSLYTIYFLSQTSLHPEQVTMGQAESHVFNSLEKNSNCKHAYRIIQVTITLIPLPPLASVFTAHVLPLSFASLEASSLTLTVSAPELLRLKKRFMKLDKDGSGSIDKDEFLQIPQIANNPLAHRMIAIFDDE